MIEALLMATLFLFGCSHPPNYILVHDEIPEDYLHDLIRIGVIEQGERVDFLYCAGKSVAEEGNLMTEDRVAAYHTVDDVLELYSAKFAEISSYELTPGSRFEDSVLEIRTGAADIFYLLLSPRRDRDEEFVEELERRMNAARLRQQQTE